VANGVDIAIPVTTTFEWRPLLGKSNDQYLSYGQFELSRSPRKREFDQCRNGECAALKRYRTLDTCHRNRICRAAFGETDGELH
jgi:hypothetical protein